MWMYQFRHGLLQQGVTLKGKLRKGPYGHESDPRVYMIKEKIGSGGYGEIWLADDQQGRRYAVKASINLEDGRKEAECTVEAAGLVLNRPECAGVPNVHDHFLTETDAYGKELLVRQPIYILVMDYIEGWTLRKIIDTKRFPERLEVFMMHQLVSLLHLMHTNTRHGLMHRDIKSDNIILSKTGRVYLIDFGCACFGPSSDEVLGTQYFMSPEVVRQRYGAPRYGMKTDIWSLGVTAIEIGEAMAPLENHPFARLNIWCCFEEIDNGRAPRGTGEIFYWTKDFMDFAEFALQKNDEDRATAADLLKTDWLRKGTRDGQQALEGLRQIAEMMSRGPEAYRRPQRELDWLRKQPGFRGRG
eukprot:gnl/TRDRNA2_/TRDRNA2_174723_c0_seq1.p1 gnl/TRDRNA2_/TRDRNA2_174723_c0~~gnl/TRDRNA2_/TRDRNA2_174723_c0_seq1.p1  ORF type:complete len:399 (-),score=57.80 gnl/TRDRNA2_/TRDRNA2_174723_c0_seq1:57-1130(-)